MTQWVPKAGHYKILIALPTGQLTRKCRDRGENMKCRRPVFRDTRGRDLKMERRHGSRKHSTLAKRGGG